MQLSQDPPPADGARIVYASIHDTLITLNKWYTVRVTIPSSHLERVMTSPEVERCIEYTIPILEHTDNIEVVHPAIWTELAPLPTA